jgi:type I restriction enzyme M protein
VARIEELGERYAATAPGLAAELMSLEKAVARHLADMGVSQ